LDRIDQKIIQLLTNDGRMSFAELGRHVNLSTPAAHRRVRALEERGVITGYTARVDSTSLGVGLSALVAIEAVGSLDALVEDFARLPDVEACWSTAGSSDLLLKVRASTPVTLERLLVRIRETAGVDRTRTTVLLDTRFERGTDPAVLLAGN
jgi:Lrp/AsnC family transcriptional regulator, leucine-responsive regulatory protein